MIKAMFLFFLTALIGFSARADVVASLDYSCEMFDRTLTGSVSIDDIYVHGNPSCMYFGKAKTLCWRFERHDRLRDIFLALRFTDQLQKELSSPDDNYISMGNIPPSEGGLFEYEITMGLLSRDLLRCTFHNVNWPGKH